MKPYQQFISGQSGSLLSPEEFQARYAELRAQAAEQVRCAEVYQSSPQWADPYAVEPVAASAPDAPEVRLTRLRLVSLPANEHIRQRLAAYQGPVPVGHEIMILDRAQMSRVEDLPDFVAIDDNVIFLLDFDETGQLVGVCEYGKSIQTERMIQLYDRLLERAVPHHQFAID